jgi:hypothetical protein
MIFAAEFASRLSGKNAVLSGAIGAIVFCAPILIYEIFGLFRPLAITTTLLATLLFFALPFSRPFSRKLTEWNEQDAIQEQDEDRQKTVFERRQIIFTFSALTIISIALGADEAYREVYQPINSRSHSTMIFSVDNGSTRFLIRTYSQGFVYSTGQGGNIFFEHYGGAFRISAKSVAEENMRFRHKLMEFFQGRSSRS